MAATGGKAPDAFRTIGELSAELGVAQHILRYWESKFPQLKPLQRAGNRRYYRPADVAVARRINRLLNEQGYTIRGVQKLLREQPEDGAATAHPDRNVAERPQTAERQGSGIDLSRLIRLRDKLAAALGD